VKNRRATEQRREKGHGRHHRECGRERDESPAAEDDEEQGQQEQRNDLDAGRQRQHRAGGDRPILRSEHHGGGDEGGQQRIGIAVEPGDESGSGGEEDEEREPARAFGALAESDAVERERSQSVAENLYEAEDVRERDARCHRHAVLDAEEAKRQRRVIQQRAVRIRHGHAEPRHQVGPHRLQHRVVRSGRRGDQRQTDGDSEECENGKTAA